MELLYFALNYRCFVPKTWLSFTHVTIRKGQNMTFSKWIKHTLLAISIMVFSAASYAWITNNSSSPESCNCPSKKVYVATTQYFPTGNCQARAANQSWFSWLIGKSRSSQFHYLDLLELLESGNKDSNTSSPTHIR